MFFEQKTRFFLYSLTSETEIHRINGVYCARELKQQAHFHAQKTTRENADVCSNRNRFLELGAIQKVLKALVYIARKNTKCFKISSLSAL